MNKLLCAAVAAVLLSACDKPPPAAATDAQTPAETPAETASAPAATEPVPEETASSESAAQTEQAPASDPAADKATDDAIDKLLGDHARYRDAIDRFQKAVAAKDAAGVAALVAYPFEATIDGKTVKIKDAAGFVAQYDKIVTPPIADAIVAQKYSALFVNAQGVMFGSGEAWVNGICKDNACKNFDVKVIRIQPAGEK